MIFQIRFQIWLLAGALAASMLAGYAVSENPIASPADHFTLASEFGERPAAIFTDFGNETTWRDHAWENRTRAEACAEFRDAANGGDRQSADLVHRIGGGSPAGSAGALAKACLAP
jgi:hypothetical protein